MKMAFGDSRLKLVYVLVLLLELFISQAYGAISEGNMRTIEGINKEGPYLGVVVPNAFEMNPLLQSPSFQPHQRLPYFDFSGRRFRIGRLNNETVIIVMTGLSMRYGSGPDDELALESDGDYTRSIGYLKFSDYNLSIKKANSSSDNLLNNVWYQPEEIFPVHGTPEERQHLFWVPVDSHYFALAKRLKSLQLGRCVNETCLPRPPKVARVTRGISSNCFVDNSAYREFLHSKFNATPIDMETAAVALVCHQQNVPFIAFRSLSDLAGGGSAVSNEAAIYSSLAAQNAVTALLKFITLLSS